MTGTKVRRATVEDLAGLVALWQSENMSAAELERNFTEFQVVEEDTGGILGAVGVRVAGLDALIYAEAFFDPAQADALRAQLWERVEIISNNFGLARLWTQINTPFWRANGFGAAPANRLAHLPQTFAGSEQPWYLIQLKEQEEPGAGVDIDKQFALFKQAEHENSQRIMQRARTLKSIAFLIVALVVIISALGIYGYFKYKSGAGNR